MSFEIKPATRTGIKPLIGIYSESGCGKTMSSLLLARGLVGPSGKIVMLDTESGRGSNMKLNKSKIKTERRKIAALVLQGLISNPSILNIKIENGKKVAEFHESNIRSAWSIADSFLDHE